jgi:hypothetical protein
MQCGPLFSLNRVTVKKPLRRVVRIGFGQAIRVFFGGDFLPMRKVEGHLGDVAVIDAHLPVYLSHRR